MVTRRLCYPRALADPSCLLSPKSRVASLTVNNTVLGWGTQDFFLPNNSKALVCRRAGGHWDPRVGLIQGSSVSSSPGGLRAAGTKFHHQPDPDCHSAFLGVGPEDPPAGNSQIRTLPPAATWLNLAPPIPLQSMAMPTAMHFLKRHSWHWLRVILSMTQQLSYLQE